VLNPALLKYVLTSVNATCFIVPLSFVTTLSASTRVVEEADVSPSMMLSSVAVAVAPSKMFNSAAVDVTPSSILSSAVVDVTPSNMFNSAAVDVTPSRMFNSAVVTVAPSSMFSSSGVDDICVVLTAAKTGIVPDTLGKLIVLSAVGSTIVSVVS